MIFYEKHTSFMHILLGGILGMKGLRTEERGENNRVSLLVGYDNQVLGGRTSPLGFSQFC